MRWLWAHDRDMIRIFKTFADLLDIAPLLQNARGKFLRWKEDGSGPEFVQQQVDPNTILTMIEDNAAPAIHKHPEYERTPIIDVTYAALKALISAAKLVPYQRYRITNYISVNNVHRQGVNEFHEGAAEPLIVMAVSPSTLDIIAYSEQHRNDIIHYSPDNLTYGEWLEYPNGKGTITFRQDTYYRIEAHFDWRAAMWYRYISNNPLLIDEWNPANYYDTADNGLGGMLVPTFAANVDNGSVYNVTLGPECTNVVFLAPDFVMDVVIGADVYDSTFGCNQVLRVAPSNGNIIAGLGSHHLNVGACVDGTVFGISCSNILVEDNVIVQVPKGKDGFAYRLNDELTANFTKRTTAIVEDYAAPAEHRHIAEQCGAVPIDATRLRAGNLSRTYQDGTMALGVSATAGVDGSPEPWNHTGSTAIGSGTVARYGGFAVGNQAIATGPYSVAMGNTCSSYGNQSVAIGAGTSAYKSGSITVGKNNAVFGPQSIAVSASGIELLQACATTVGTIATYASIGMIDYQYTLGSFDGYNCSIPEADVVTGAFKILTIDALESSLVIQRSIKLGDILVGPDGTEHTVTGFTWTSEVQIPGWTVSPPATVAGAIQKIIPRNILEISRYDYEGDPSGFYWAGQGQTFDTQYVFAVDRKGRIDLSKYSKGWNSEQVAFFDIRYIEEAPNDGKLYGRKNGQWVEIP